MMTICLFFVFLLHTSSHAEDCSIVTTTITSGTDPVFSTIGTIASLAPANIFKSAIMGIFTLANWARPSNDQVVHVMNCKTDFPAVITQDIDQLFTLNFVTTVFGYDEALQSYRVQRGYLQQVFGNNSASFQKQLSAAGGPIETLSHLNEDMLEDQQLFFLPSTFAVGAAELYPIIALPYMSVYVNVRTMALADLFIYAASTINIQYARNYYGGMLLDLICNVTDYIDETYTQSLIQLRPSQISCNVMGPNCNYNCARQCSGGNQLPTYDGDLDTPDQSNNNFHISGYPKHVSCANIDPYCYGIYEIINNKPVYQYAATDQNGNCQSGWTYHASAWNQAVQNCKNDVQNLQNNITNQILTELNNLKAALYSAKKTLFWMMGVNPKAMCWVTCNSISRVSCMPTTPVVYIKDLTDTFYLYLQGSVSTTCAIPSASGCNGVVADVSAHPYVLHQNNNSYWCIISLHNNQLYLRADGSNIVSYNQDGGGIVNIQIYTSPSDCVGYEQFKIYSTYGTGWVIESVAFPGRFVRMTPSQGVSVNLQYYPQFTLPGTYETFDIQLVNPVNNFLSVEESAKVEGLAVETIVGIFVGVGVGVVVLVIVVVIVIVLKQKTASVYDEALRKPLT